MQAIAQWLKENTCDHQSIVVAYSGGRDSHVLLHALWQQRELSPSFELSAIHVNHGLQEDANDWVIHCRKVCQSYDIPFETVSLQLKPLAGESIENVAREQRYLAFASCLKPNAMLLTAHTEDDQAETFVLQLIRGSGIKGLAGIAPLKRLGQGKLARPFLAVKRAQIDAYATQHQLVWIEDKTNALLRFRRNFIRHEILPRLKDINPAIETCIARSAQHCKETQHLLNEYIVEDLESCLGEAQATLSVQALSRLSPLKQPYILRAWLESQGAPLPSVRKLNDILNQMLTAKEDTTPCVTWANMTLRRYKGALYLKPLKKRENVLFLDQKSKLWNFDLPLILPESTWEACLEAGQGIATSKLSEKSVRVAYRQGGERCRPVGRKGSQTLKKLLQEYEVPHWERPTLPLFYHEDELIGVGSLFICEGWQVQSLDEKGWVIKKSLLTCL